MFLTSVLLPLKNTVTYLEGSDINLADCFLSLIRLAVKINMIPNDDVHLNFKNHCIKAVNDRWDSIDILPYMLAYFLHPSYRGKVFFLSKDLKNKRNRIINFHYLLFRCRIKVNNMAHFNKLRGKTLLVHVKE